MTVRALLTNDDPVNVTKSQVVSCRDFDFPIEGIAWDIYPDQHKNTQNMPWLGPSTLYMYK